MQNIQFPINCDNAKVSNDKNLDRIVDIQWNKGQISSTMIKISFRIIGLPNKNYGYEDYLFKGF